VFAVATTATMAATVGWTHSTVAATCPTDCSRGLPLKATLPVGRSTHTHGNVATRFCAVNQRNRPARTVSSAWTAFATKPHPKDDSYCLYLSIPYAARRAYIRETVARVQLVGELGVSWLSIVDLIVDYALEVLD
jgi:hypothetical protein